MTVAARVGCLVVACLLGLSTPIAAQSPPTGDPCAGVNAKSTLTHPARIRIEHDTAIFIVKHVQRACRRMDAWIHAGAPPMNPARVAALRGLAAKIQSDVLAPIYGAYPEMRDRDLTEATANPPVGAGSAGGSVLRGQSNRIGFATALHLRWALEELEATLFNAPADSPLHCKKDAPAACGQAITDIGAEFSFAAAPIYAAYPDLWRLAMQHSAAALPAPQRTAKSDAEFRKAKAAAGPLRLTPAALAYLGAFANELRKDETGCQMLTISWMIDEKTKGPEDKDWKSLGPGVTAGAYECQFVPPDVVQIIDGVKVAVSGEDAERFAGKTIDLENHKLVLRDR